MQLLDGFRSALRQLGVEGFVGAVDASEAAPAFLLADERWQVPRLDDPAYLDSVLAICRDHGIRLLVPTIDTELGLYAAAREDFAKVGCTVAVSAPEAVAIAGDKRLTHSWLKAQGIPTVEQHELGQVASHPDSVGFPLIAKPARGSMSQGVLVVQDARGLPRADSGDLILQSVAAGLEHTVSVLVSRAGRCRAAVPRRRLEVRHGEVSKGVTVRDERLESLATRVVEDLPGTYGALNVQIFMDEATGDLRVIEINARFGGGDPLAWHAGADFPTWMIEELLGKGAEPRPNDWTGNVRMLRFDRAAYIDADGSVSVG